MTRGRGRIRGRRRRTKIFKDIEAPPIGELKNVYENIAYASSLKFRIRFNKKISKDMINGKARYYQD